MAVPRLRMLMLLAAVMAWPTLAAAQECRQTVWRRLSLNSHYGAPVVYHDGLQGCVVFAEQPWLWDGQAWQSFPVGMAVQPRNVDAIAYDPVRGVVVAHFPGSPGPMTTQEWTPELGWTVAASGDLPRSGFSLIYDPGLARTLLIGGGTGGSRFGDTWAWDGQSWTQLAATLPGRSDHATALDEQRGVVVLYGGHDGSAYTRDTWEFDGASWRLADAAGPVQGAMDSGQYSLFTGADGRAYLLHQTNEPQPRLWRWDGAAWTELAVPGFEPRRWASVAFDRGRGALVVAGGQLEPMPGTIGGLASDVWEWSGGVWSRAHSAVGPTRGGIAMAYDAQRDRTVVFGGSTYQSAVTDETWLHDGERWELSAATGPEPRHSGVMAFDARRGRIVLHGGVNAKNAPMRDTWEWDGAAWTLVSTSGPEARGPVMAYDAVGERCLLVPGDGTVWAWDGLNWAMVEDTGPKTSNHCVAIDPIRQMLVVDQIGYFSVAEWDGQDWHLLPGFFEPISGAAMAFDPRLSRCVRFGGTDLDAFVHPTNLILEWDGIQWSGLYPTWQMPARSGHGLVWDSQRERIVLHGGFGLADTWVSYSVGIDPPGIISHPFPVSARIGQTIAMEVGTRHMASPTPATAETYQWTRDGVPLADGPAIFGLVSGSDTPSLRIENAQLAASGVYRALVTNACQMSTSDPAAVSVTGCPGDLTAGAIAGTPGYGEPDGIRNNDDFFYYLAQFSAGNLAVADLTTTGAPLPGMPGHGVPDGVLDADDFLTFLVRFQSTCG